MVALKNVAKFADIEIYSDLHCKTLDSSVLIDIINDNCFSVLMNNLLYSTYI